MLFSDNCKHYANGWRELTVPLNAQRIQSSAVIISCWLFLKSIANRILEFLAQHKVTNLDLKWNVIFECFSRITNSVKLPFVVWSSAKSSLLFGLHCVEIIWVSLHNFTHILKIVYLLNQNMVIWWLLGNWSWNIYYLSYLPFSCWLDRFYSWSGPVLLESRELSKFLWIG